MTDKEAMKLALDALETCMYPQQKQLQAITALKEALAQPEQEPVAYATKEDFHRELERRLKHIREEMKIKSVTMRCKDYDIALPIIDTDFGRVLVGQVFTPPQRTEPMIDQSAAIRIATALGWTPQRPWVGLTDDEISAITSKVIGFNSCVGWEEDYARAIEQALKEVNA
jgi:hypothetical protein